MWFCLSPSLLIVVFPKVPYLHPLFLFYLLMILHQLPTIVTIFPIMPLHCSLSHSGARQATTNIGHDRAVFSASLVSDLRQNDAWGAINHACFTQTPNSFSSVKLWLCFSSFHWITSTYGLAGRFFSLLVLYVNTRFLCCPKSVCYFVSIALLLPPISYTKLKLHQTFEC